MACSVFLELLIEIVDREIDDVADVQVVHGDLHVNMRLEVLPEHLNPVVFREFYKDLNSTQNWLYFAWKLTLLIEASPKGGDVP